MLPVSVEHVEQGYVAEPDTGEVVPLNEASDRAIVTAIQEVADHDRQVLTAKRALAAELRMRHGVGTASAGGYRFVVKEQTSWPVGATQAALDRLVRDGKITQADARRALPPKPTPNAVELKSLAARLVMSDPDAARVLIGACTTSPPAVYDLKAEAIDDPGERCQGPA